MSILDLIEHRQKSISRRHARKTLKDTVIGAALGLTVGAVAGVLLTPKSGKETREELVNAARELPGKAREAMEKAKGQVKDTKEKLRESKEKLQEAENKAAADLKEKL